MLTYLISDPDHPAVVLALTNPCDMCGAEVGQPCRSITPLPLNRVVHVYRLEKP